MSHLPTVGKKSFAVRAYLLFVYGALIFMGLTMIVPFLITISGSFSNDYDYQRFLPFPRYLWSSDDRFTKGLVNYFNNSRNWKDQMQAYYPEIPEHWASWTIIGQDIKGSDALAKRYLSGDKADWERWELMARDYSEFSDSYPMVDTQSAIKEIEAIEFLKDFYEYQTEIKDPEKANQLSRGELRNAARKLLSETWGIPFESFFNANFSAEESYPLGFQSWYPSVENPKYQDFVNLKQAYKMHVFTPGVKAKWLNLLAEKKISYAKETDVFPVNKQTPQEVKDLWPEFKAKVAPASPTIPFAMRAVWYKFLQSEQALQTVNLSSDTIFNIGTYNKLAGTDYLNLQKTPFPIPADFNADIKKLWDVFVRDYYPLRLTTIKPTPEIISSYHKLMQKELKNITMANKLLGENHKSWDQFKLPESLPVDASAFSKNRCSLWLNFVKQLPENVRFLSSSEMSFQKFLLKKYGSLEKINTTYNWNIKYIEEAFPPFAAAYAITERNNEIAFMFEPVLANYWTIFDYLLLNANAVPVTLLLISLAIICTLTINPLAAYALSRFNLKGKEKILLFLLATMAFPAMVSAIPAYLLMRDLGMLNTFLALLLPGAANGMAIFILKGFFDSLPLELFEAATIDGASELQIFRIVAMPLVKPILAINSLGAFMAAYNGWAWALIICQKKSMWTIAVWLYQANMWWGHMPWLVSAGFVIASIPTMIVFLSCQKIILRGIIIPSMK